MQKGVRIFTPAASFKYAVLKQSNKHNVKKYKIIYLRNYLILIIINTTPTWPLQDPYLTFMYLHNHYSYLAIT